MPPGPNRFCPSSRAEPDHFSKTRPTPVRWGGFARSPLPRHRRPVMPLRACSRSSLLVTHGDVWLPAESATLGLGHLQFEALITTARLSANPNHFALVAMLGLLGLRIFEFCGASISDLGEEHGHRVLRVRGKGGKVVLVPLPARGGPSDRPSRRLPRRRADPAQHTRSPDGSPCRDTPAQALGRQRRGADA
jgi:hypothetical protein